MRYESVLNRKEYFHFVFQIFVLISAVLLVDIKNPTHIGLSYAIVGTFSLAYLMQAHTFEFDSLSGWQDDKNGKATDYNIVAPFGMALIVFWIAYLDYMTPEVISQHTGVLLLFLVVFSAASITEIKRRAAERFVHENSTFIHYTIVGVINSVIWLVGIRYFIVEGTWEWGTPSLIDVFNALLGVKEYR
jgi:hypothetical protein